MMREYHVRICEGLGVKFPGSTRHSRRLNDVGMSASPPTPDVSLRGSEPTLRANECILHCGKPAALNDSIFVVSNLRHDLSGRRACNHLNAAVY